MATIADLDDVYRVRIYSRFDEQNAINVRYIQFIARAAGIVVYDTDLAKAVSADLGAAVRNVMGPSAVYRGCSLERISGIQTQPIFSIEQSGAGGGGGEMLPPQVAGLINLRTTRAGRPGIGRMFVPFPAESVNQATGKPTATYVTALNDMGALLISARSFLAAGGGGSNFYRYGFWDGKNKTFWQLSQALARDRWSQIRRRSFLRRPDAQPPL